MSTFAVGVSGLPTEGHFLYTRSWLLTVHAGADASMDRARAMCRVLTEKITSNHVAVVLIILTEFMASFDPLLEHTDELLGELEDQVLRVPKAAKLQQLAVLRKQMWSLHRLWEPPYERIRNFALAIAGLPELSNEAQSFNDYAERISDLIDKINDLRQRAERRYGELWDECLQQAVTSHEPFDDHLRYLSAADLSDRLPRDEFSMDD
ncbi:MAG TPA: hypothetical protein DCP92_19800 [Nitrospiraceae bacterium]|nr:hypothetical protein [Nitrospiraceae bacterium]